MLAIQTPFPQYFDIKDGSPLDGGKLYFGQPNQNPETNPITVYWDVAGTQPAAQPIRTLNGFAARAGTPANLYVLSDYSLTIRDKRGRNPVYQPSSVAFGNLGLISRVIGPGQTVVVNVPADYATVAAALTGIAGWVILGTVQIQLADGTYNLTAGIVANHPFGANIQLLGNLGAPANVSIRGTNPPTFDALTVSGGNQLGLVDGITFDLPVKAVLANNFTGVLALNGGNIKCGPNLRINNWYYGAAARNGSVLYCRNIQVTNAGDVGIWSYLNSTVDAQGATSTGAVDAVNGFGYGFQAERGSSIDATGVHASGCQIGGIAALSNSHVDAPGAISSNNIGSGFYVRDGATIEAHGSTASNNTRFGQESIDSGRFYANTFTTAGNTLGANNGYAYLDNTGSTSGARVAANGDFRIDINGPDNWFFNSPGGVQFQIQHTAASASWVLATGGTTGAFLRAVGAGANYDLSVQGKGVSGSTFLGNNGANYFRVNPAASGTPASLRAEGVDANIDFMFGGKGTGLPRFGDFTASADAPVVGSVLMKDFAGTIHRLAII